MVIDCSGQRWAFSVCLLVTLAPRILATTSTVPAPIVVSPSQYWEGDDGPWSTFTIQVGTPAQNVRVLISSAGSATWVVLPEGCISSGPSDCANLRGQEFNLNASSTWSFNNYYELELESNLGYAGSGEFGFDTVGIGWQGSGSPVLEHQVVAGIATSDFWLGSFGLTPRPTNFTDFNDPQPSFMETLKNQSKIPSLSWSYTAGAPYRFEKVPGSLVLGGYDLSKAGTNMSFAFAPDISRDLTVGLQAISATVNGQDHELLPTGIFTFVDSTVPHIWLPIEACQQFESAFGLTWDSTTNLYLVNDTLHADLLSSNASLTFKIGNTTEGGSTVDIILPYASFDLTVAYPIVANSSRYFPIVRAANDTQYTLGRTFLQEAYLSVDYERSKFYVSQAQWIAGANEHIITITAANSTSTGSSESSGHGLSTGAIVGIAIGCFLVGVIVIAGLLFFLKRRRSKTTAQTVGDSGYPPDAKDQVDGFGKAELDAGGPGHEIGGTAIEYFQPNKVETHEVPSPTEPRSPPPPPSPAPVYEMVGDGVTLPELPASTVRPHEVG